MKVEVALAGRSYDVSIGSGVRHELSTVLKERCGGYQMCVILTSPSLTYEPWFDFVPDGNVHVLEVPEGEDTKTLEILESVCEDLAELKFSRSDVLVGVGGGAITDFAGFVAAVYLRGVRVIHVPTTLIGQVDAAVGGKTAVNLSSGKNLVGAFHQPVAVLCDDETLRTLHARDRRSGLGEVAKCWLLEGRDPKDVATTSLEELIHLSVGLKARIVSGDEFEGGQRALLNYGHTLAHAIESLSLRHSRDELRHGEAVAIGLAFAVRLAHALGRVGANEVARHDEVLAAFELSTTVPKELVTEEIVRVMGHDKKAHHDLTFVLAGPTGFELVAGIDPALVTTVLEEFRGET